MLEHLPVEEPRSQFKTPEEEIAFLREQIRLREKQVEALGNTTESRFDTAKDAIINYSRSDANELLHKSHPYHSEEAGIKLPLNPEKDDPKMAELLGIMMESGVKRALSVLRALNNPHLEDDFHRFLVQYLVVGLDKEDLKKNKELYKDINTILYEVVMPEEIENGKSFKETAALMEQLYITLGSLGEGRDNEAGNYFTLEVGLANGSNEVVIYASVPRIFASLFEKQVTALFPKARVIEKTDDYNIFNEDGATIGVYGQPSEDQSLPIKLYSEFEEDPFTVLLNTFDRFKQHGEGALLQIVIMPRGTHFTKKFGDTLDELRKGKKLKDLGNDLSLGEFGKTAFSFFTGTKLEEEKKDDTRSHVDEDAIRLVGEKIKSPIVDTNIRIAVSAESTERARMMLREIETAFTQYHEPLGNSFFFKEVTGRATHDFFKDISYRTWRSVESFPLSIKELTGIFHFPLGVKGFASLKQSSAQGAPAPLDLPQKGTLLGINKYRNLETPVYLDKEDRVRHFYVVGQTGTGKTGILKNMIIQDIQAGNGCCFIDPHGSDIDDILANIPPERLDDVIYFDPSNTERVMGLNMLEYDPRFPEQRSNVVDELFGIFNKLFDMKTAGGPAFEQYFRNAAFTVMAHPESGNTLMEIGRVMSDKAFRDAKLQYVTNPLVRQFWQNAEKTSGETGLANFVPYITNKFDVFLSNDYMRPIVTQEKSSFNFRDIMDGKKIFLANLAKGRLGDMNSSLLGLIIVGKLTMAALSRVDAPVENRPDFYLYIDEFQNFTTPSITTILSEARKYRLSLNVAHQYIGQLPEDIKGAVFGNVGSMAVFRVGVEDAEFLEKYFNPPFTASDIFKLENRNAYIKILANGNPQKPFNIVTVDSPRGDQRMKQAIKDLSSLKYGTPRTEVEEMMMKKFNMM